MEGGLLLFRNFSYLKAHIVAEKINFCDGQVLLFDKAYKEMTKELTKFIRLRL